MGAPVNTKSGWYRWPAFAIVAAGVFMATLDSSMVNLALPSIMSEFGSPLKDTEWVVLVYLLTITSTLLLWGHLGDRISRRNIYPLGMLIFAGGSLACTWAPMLSFLVGARLLQATGAAMMMAIGPAVVKDLFPPGQLGQGLGMISVSVSLGLMTGPVLSGLIMEFFSWRAIFFVTVPIGLLFAAMGRRLLPAGPQESCAPAIDWRPATAWTALLSFVSLALSTTSSPDWSGKDLGVFATLAAGSLAAFTWLEARAAEPFLPVRLIRQRFFGSAIACSVLSFLCLATVMVLTPFYLDRILGLSKASIGAIMMTVPLSVLIASPMVGYLTDFVGARILASLGIAGTVTGVFLLSGLGAATPPRAVVLRLLVLGLGQAFFLAPNSASVLSRVGQADSGKSAALLATARNLGMLLGISLAGLVFAQRFGLLTGGHDLRDFMRGVHDDAFLAALRAAFRAAATAGAVALAISWRRGGKALRPEASRAG